MNQKFCTNCGSPIPQGSRVCPHCGTPILSEDNSEAYPSQPTHSYHQPNNIAQPDYPTPQNNKNTFVDCSDSSCFFIGCSAWCRGFSLYEQ